MQEIWNWRIKGVPQYLSLSSADINPILIDVLYLHCYIVFIIIFCRISFIHWTRLWTIRKPIIGTPRFFLFRNYSNIYTHETILLLFLAKNVTFLFSQKTLYTCQLFRLWTFYCYRQAVQRLVFSSMQNFYYWLLPKYNRNNHF